MKLEKVQSILLTNRARLITISHHPCEAVIFHCFSSCNEFFTWCSHCRLSLLDEFAVVQCWWLERIGQSRTSIFTHGTIESNGKQLLWYRNRCVALAKRRPTLSFSCCWVPLEKAALTFAIFLMLFQYYHCWLWCWNREGCRGFLGRKNARGCGCIVLGLYKAGSKQKSQNQIAHHFRQIVDWIQLLQFPWYNI